MEPRILNHAINKKILGIIDKDTQESVNAFTLLSPKRERSEPRVGRTQGPKSE